MLQRIYGIAFPKKEELDEYLRRQEEARKRDHNKLGRELEFFTTVDVIGQGLPILLPKGAKVIQTLQRWVEDEEEKRGYLLTKTPIWPSGSCTRFPATGTTTWTACSSWETPTMKPRIASPCGP